MMASGHRPLPSHSLCGRVPLSAGDHSVCTPVSTSGRLDGLHRSQGSVSSGAGSSCFSSLSSLHVLWHGLPVQSSVLCPLHGSAGLHQGHGSCFQLYSILWVSVCVDTSTTGWSSLPLGSLSLRICRLSSNFVKNWGLSSTPEVQPHTFPGSSVSGGRRRLHLFQGFSVGGTHLAAALNSRRVSVLRLAYRELVAVASRRSFFAGSPRSWRQTEVAVPPALPPSFLEPSGSGSSSVGVDGVSSDLQWWLHLPRLSLGVSLRRVSPDLHFWSDASDVGWGAHLGGQVASGLWATQQAALSINARELLAVQLGLFQFRSALNGRTLAVFCDNATAVAYLRKAGGTRSSTPWLRRSCAGRSPSPCAWLHSSFRAPTTS